MDAYYNYIKSLHLIFVITWFAGLFYIVRLFVYHAEAKAKPEAGAKYFGKAIPADGVPLVVHHYLAECGFGQCFRFLDALRNHFGQ